MNRPLYRVDKNYSDDLAQWTQALAFNASDKVSPVVHEKERMIQLFSEGNFQKRYEKLERALELLPEVFLDHQTIFRRFITSNPLKPYDTVLTDADSFLDWFWEQQSGPSVEQTDVWLAEKARLQVEKNALDRPMQHRGFQSISKVQMAKGPLNFSDKRLTINPVATWVSFESSHFVGEDTDLPASVLFYPVETQIRTSIVEPEAKPVLQSLQSQSLTPKELAKMNLGTVEGICFGCEDFIALGILIVSE